MSLRLRELQASEVEEMSQASLELQNLHLTLSGVFRSCKPSARVKKAACTKSERMHVRLKLKLVRLKLKLSFMLGCRNRAMSGRGSTLAADR